MHLLAAKPGGFVDDEGIIDLEQEPAEVVILAAADSVLSALGGALDRLPDLNHSVRLANWMQLAKPAAYDLYESAVLEHASVAVLSLLGGVHYWQYGFDRLVAWSRKKGRTLIVVPGDDSPDPELLKKSTTSGQNAHRIWRYLRESGAQNSEQLFYFIESEFLGEAHLWREPVVLPNASVVVDGEAASFNNWCSKYRAYFSSKASVTLIIFYRSHLQSGNTNIFSDLEGILLTEQQIPLSIAVNSLKDDQSIALIERIIARVNFECSGSKVNVILNTTGFAANRFGVPDLASEPTTFESSFESPLPVLQLILSGSTKEDWQEQSQGLRSRDVAMQIVLPEMDGRIITRAVSFKALSKYHDTAQIDLVKYELERERASFVAKLAAKYAQLSIKQSSEKRIALILANYPTKDGRIGNGVGLDTPASTVNILNKMADAGYSVENIPDNGNALIEALLGAVTNNPNSLHERRVWQSLALDTYLDYFYQLPLECQQAVWDRWGPPEDDHKCRTLPTGERRIMLAGIRLGETFIGIQPARGFNLDLAANYHDPDLIPPHSYLAYYFWLRHVYQVDAIIHVGKHGNLEWLPGKGTALSESCWPDIAMGPMPHFYPFIVNDPGEGSQAKRRTQATIIDHLMPPMTRAETYGEMAELEALVDEYYQAMGMDTRREDWLRQSILEKVQTTHLLEELSGADATDDESVLEGLDAYLCDIKESQIRHGLHRFGRLPEDDKLSDTLVALLRLPRGNSTTSQGILHSLCKDLGIKEHEFDPMEASSSPWLSDRPLILLQQSTQTWRTHADAKERLELLAKTLVHQSLILDQEVDQECYPETSQLLRHAKLTLFKALQQSAHDELNALLIGLQGGFVPPGPSGAPTRGRLDTLPTGRNFFSVDNRAIPSPAAWAIGRKSADALVLRHLQEQGDYPSNIGLSVWGTSTMRTGGDDIAQAFALMGVRPIWAEGSNRVTDFEVVSCMELGRPRIDVTLRVSGFFRDAFSNVMRLYDAAVQAIAEYEEPGTGNTIRKNIDEQCARLEAQGISAEEAKRQASYRVFGSKPGAYGAGLQGLIDERCWDTQADLAEAYVNWGGYAYDGRASGGVEAKSAFVQRLSSLEVVVQNQDNREHDILDSDDYYQFQGGMTNAVTELSGSAPDIYHNDHSNPTSPKIRTLKEELNRVVRSRVLNPKWISSMREHGYKGAFEMSATVDYLFAYDATTDLVADYQYEKVTETLLLDSTNRAFMEENNPHALEEMAERLMEAIQRGMWQDAGEYEEKIQSVLLDLDQQQEQPQ
ncbi:cobaltochelatase subunit CobN [Marinomonas mediterranea]|uniref:Cobaltochelatase subunit CobN n=1 Tax=Marinomonas mediterranea (strain ATCC 700492 / JCM 21426 / NBRC 103028 / MMB-1) TaxID=717774 RepID=F2JVK6_MARM1|nr:cobaltochelatase subunit CobN [Marinomonas mediterranea]ADZ90550.1 cobaltochelatase, CobN subunit [Marinomonas mediterranea MMB-1]WCN16727.1 cobaltochelatase subunit CobN [Marinomonas mediterranea MMB-1]